MVEKSMVIQVKFPNAALFLRKTVKQSRVGNGSESLKLKIHTADVEAEISKPDNLSPVTVKDLAQETED